MPRRRRVHVCGGIYHVTLRGNHRQRIFLDHGDEALLASLFAEYTRKYGMSVHAFCWMPNHIHVALEVADRPLADAMRPIATRYSRALQRRRGTTGHLFERRFHAVLVDSQRYLFTLVRYIHMNPVRAGLTEDPADHRWSSHRAYLGLDSHCWLTIGRVLEQLGADRTVAMARYSALIRQELAADELALMRCGESADRRAAQAERSLCLASITDQPQLPANLMGKLISEACRVSGARRAELSTPRRSRQLGLARALVTWEATRRGAATLRELGTVLGRRPSSLTENLSAARRRFPDYFAPPDPQTAEDQFPNKSE